MLCSFEKFTPPLYQKFGTSWHTRHEKRVLAPLPALWALVQGVIGWASKLLRADRVAGKLSARRYGPKKSGAPGELKLCQRNVMFVRFSLNLNCVPN
jgi:hypothetical protein